MGPAEARREQWVSATVCGSCHETELKIWKRGPHASASRSLGTRVGEGRCESCHGTGDAPAGRNYLRDVQCEACHGAGKHYGVADIMRDPVLAHALGLRKLSDVKARSVVCMRCHDASTSFTNFDVEAAWARIGHEAH